MMNMNELVVMLLVVGLCLFFIGMHDIDNAWNMSSTCWDSDLLGNLYTRAELYKLGLALCFAGVIGLVSAVFLSAFIVNKPLNFRMAK